MRKRGGDDAERGVVQVRTEEKNRRVAQRAPSTSSDGGLRARKRRAAARNSSSLKTWGSCLGTPLPRAGPAKEIRSARPAARGRAENFSLTCTPHPHHITLHHRRLSRNPPAVPQKSRPLRPATNPLPRISPPPQLTPSRYPASRALPRGPHVVSHPSDGNIPLPRTFAPAAAARFFAASTPRSARPGYPSWSSESTSPGPSPSTSAVPSQSPRAHPSPPPPNRSAGLGMPPRRSRRRRA